MKLEIIRYNDKIDRQRWEDFINHSINGTFLHSRAFFDHNPLNEQDDLSLLYLKKNKVVGVIPCACYTKDDKKVLHSHPRSTYGGFVVNEEIGVEEAVEMVEKLIEEGKRLEVSEIIIRNPFRIFQTKLCDETDYAMWYHGFKLKAREVEIAVDISRPLNEIQATFSNSNKYNIKKAKKTVQVKETKDFAAFWTMLEQNLSNRYQTKPVHNLEAIDKLISNVGEEKVLLFGAYMNDKLISGTLLFVTTPITLHAQYIASDHTYQEYRSLNAVMDYVIEWGNARGYKYFNLGTANEDGGKYINTGLFHFKESFGGRGVLRETMSLTL